MRVDYTTRGFELIERRKYGTDTNCRLVQQSSAIDGERSDSIDNPGSSYLWFGQDHHLNREEVADLIKNLRAWVDTGSLVVAEEKIVSSTQSESGGAG